MISLVVFSNRWTMYTEGRMLTIAEPRHENCEVGTKRALAARLQGGSPRQALAGGVQTPAYRPPSRSGELGRGGLSVAYRPDKSSRRIYRRLFGAPADADGPASDDSTVTLSCIQRLH